MSTSPARRRCLADIAVAEHRLRGNPPDADAVRRELDALRRLDAALEQLDSWADRAWHGNGRALTLR